MKIISKIIITAFLFLSCQAWSQDTVQHPKIKLVNDTPYAERYKKLKELYIASLHSESAIYASKLKADFFLKVNFTEEDNTVMGIKENMFGWIRDNLHKTGFESYEEAVRDFEEIEAATEKELEENPEFLNYFLESTRFEGPHIFTDIDQELRMMHPEMFHLYRDYEFPKN